MTKQRRISISLELAKLLRDVVVPTHTDIFDEDGLPEEDMRRLKKFVDRVNAVEFFQKEEDTKHE